MLPCISALHWARKRTWFVMCGGRCHVNYGPLIETNYFRTNNDMGSIWNERSRVINLRM